ncbi:MAG TPA: hypothetical protein PLB00_07990 [Pseudomonadota bacterium]|nr:hypothetical protein [Pseudomonadota bacterium]
MKEVVHSRFDHGTPERCLSNVQVTLAWQLKLRKADIQSVKAA